jgi:hypothetical protein
LHTVIAGTGVDEGVDEGDGMAEEEGVGMAEEE